MKLFRRSERSPSLHLLDAVKRVDKPKRRLILTAMDQDQKNWLRRLFKRFFTRHKHKIKD